MMIEPPGWVTLLANLSFPMCITIYLYLRFEKKLDNLENSLKYLTDVIKDIGRG